MVIQERYTGIVASVNAVVPITGPSFGGFIAVTSGTLTLVTNSGVTLLSGFPVTSGTFHKLPLYTSQHGAVLTLSDGASGTVLV